MIASEDQKIIEMCWAVGERDPEWGEISHENDELIKIKTKMRTTLTIDCDKTRVMKWKS